MRVLGYINYICQNNITLECIKCRIFNPEHSGMLRSLILKYTTELKNVAEEKFNVFTVRQMFRPFRQSQKLSVHYEASKEPLCFYSSTGPSWEPSSLITTTAGKSNMSFLIRSSKTTALIFQLHKEMKRWNS